MLSQITSPHRCANVSNRRNSVWGLMVVRAMIDINDETAKLILKNGTGVIRNGAMPLLVYPLQA